MGQKQPEMPEIGELRTFVPKNTFICIYPVRGVSP
jgi:hypothetical protein